ncbi:MAG: HAD-IA family hydrolase [Deltaproteobacteria bacterium]|nr:HAD-IA family hydrolase [Deltaproteobacteria bacterium]
MELQALIFDVDGTIANTEEVHRETFNEIFSKYGLGWHWDRPLYHRLLKVTGGKERIRHYMETTHPDMLSRPGLADWIAELHREKTALYNQRVLAGEIPLRAGVRRLMEEARGLGVKLAIATTTSRVNVESLLISALGADSLGWFSAWGTGESSSQKKPHPGVYLKVLEELNLPAQACLALEDSANGLRSAAAAGIPVLITVSPYTEEDDFSGAMAVTDGLGDPGQPPRWIQGGKSGMVSLALLREWFRPST